MYHIKSITKFVNGRPRFTGGHEITDDNGFIVESFADEALAKYYETLNKDERTRKKMNKPNAKLVDNGIIHDIDGRRRIENIGWTNDGETRYDTKLFIIFDPESWNSIMIRYWDANSTRFAMSISVI